LVCHSMGARVVATALSELGRHKTPLPALHQVIFAAADVPVSSFPEFWAGIQQIQGVKFSFYDSNHDLALRLSHIAHGEQRVGDAAPTIYTPVGAISVDASRLDSPLQAFGHSYITNSLRVAEDLGQWVDTGAQPEARGLVKVSEPGRQYYRFP
jgi:esterase/lipase superfamily enzyme